MEKKMQMSGTEEFQMIYVDIPPSSGVYVPSY